MNFQKEYNLEEEKQYEAYIDELETLIEIWERSIDRRRGRSVDIQFWETYEYFKYVDGDIIFEQTKQRFLSLPEGMRLEFLSLPRRYDFLQGRIDMIEGDFSLIRQHVDMMTEKVEAYKWLYEHLADYRSKKVLNGIIEYWFDFNIEKLHSLTETVFADYFDLDIVQCDENEVIADLGAFTGDSIEDYIRTYGAYRKIYVYELTPSTYETLVNNVSGYPNVVPIQKGVSDKSGTMYVENRKNIGGNRILEQGDTEVEIVTLDEDIQEPITLIKMDVEGAEKDSIIGAKSHIESDRLKLLISSYHIPADIFDVPLLINEIRNDYKFYMRFNGCGLWPCDYVLFAV